LRQADQVRTDFAAIEHGLEFIIAQLAQVPRRRDFAWVTAAFFAGGVIVATWSVSSSSIEVARAVHRKPPRLSRGQDRSGARTWRLAPHPATGLSSRSPSYHLAQQIVLGPGEKLDV
jgi:hypothetical protein